MLCIEKIRFLSKIEGFLDRVASPETAIKIILDETFEIPQLIGNTKQNTTDWQQNPIPPIELSPYQKDYKILFGIYREGTLIGKNSTSFSYAQPRKDVLEIIGSDNQINGKLVYQLNWIKSANTGNYITYQQYCNSKSKSGGLGSKETLIKPQITTQRQKKYVRKVEDQDCGGFCSCFAVRKKKAKKPEIQASPQIKIPNQRIQQIQQPKISNGLKIQVDQKPLNQKFSNAKLINNPLIYTDQQLQNGRINDVQQLNRLTYYSKDYVISK